MNPGPDVQERRSLPRRRGEEGMTLVEILVVITILGIVIAILTVNVFGLRDAAMPKLAKMGIKTLEDAVNIFKLQHSRLPETLEELVNPPQELGAPRSGYIKREQLLDPWRRPYDYRPLEDGGVEIISFGADGQPGGIGENADISNRDTEAR
jgi:general secretion pathway protein G